MPSSPSRTIVMVTHVVPYPPSAGNEMRIYKLLQWLKSKGYHVHLVIRQLDAMAVPEASLKALREVTEETLDLTLATHGTKMRMQLLLRVVRRLRAYARIPAPRTERMEDAFCPPSFLKEVRRVCRRVKPDAFIAQYIFMTRCFSLLPHNTLKVIDCIDVFSRKKDKVLAYGIDDSLAMDPGEEAPLLHRGELVIAIQDEEREAIRKMIPDRKVITVGIDFDLPQAANAPDSADPNALLFVASGNRLNNRGLREFLERSWPSIRAQCPNAQLRVVGKVKPGIDAPTGVSLLGFVLNLEQEYRRAALVINPVIAGTGLKIKTVEALSRGKPLVAFPNGVEGIPNSSPPAFLLARDWPEFSRESIRALTSSELRQGLGAAARKLVEERFATEAVYRDLGRELEAHFAAQFPP
jgi:glycosyltransferase involved in cell wall biosynthesis